MPKKNRGNAFFWQKIGDSPIKSLERASLYIGKIKIKGPFQKLGVFCRYIWDSPHRSIQTLSVSRLVDLFQEYTLLTIFLIPTYYFVTTCQMRTV
jgi:hypothetical protein